MILPATQATVNFFPINVCDGGGSCINSAKTGSILFHSAAQFLFIEHVEWEQCLTDSDCCCVSPCFMIQIVNFASVLSPVSCGHTRNLPGAQKLITEHTDDFKQVISFDTDSP